MPIVASGGKTLRVAILDDHAAFADALCLAISATSGMSCVGHAGTISRCVALGLETEPDVVILDYQLIEGDGIECAHALRDAGVDSDLIMLTAAATDELEDRAAAAGIEGGVLPKHTPLSDVLAAVRDLAGP